MKVQQAVADELLSSADDREQMYRQIAAFATSLYPQALSCRLLIQIPSGGGVVEASLPVPLPPPADADAEEKVLYFLGGLKPGFWATGRTIAEAAELEYGGGRFNSVMATLTGPGGPVESIRNKGYRLRST